MNRLAFGPLSIDQVGREEALSAAESFILNGRPGQILTLNALMFRAALKDGSFADKMNSAALIIADSVGISWASRFLTGSSSERIPGIDFLHMLSSLASEKGYGIYLLGASPGTAEKAAKKLKELYPGLKVSGTCDGYFNVSEEKNILEEIRSSGAKILFVGLAVPRQDTWISDNLGSFGASVVMGVGGSFDVISGMLKRAPLWMRKAGLEWLFRTLQQPWRITRIKELPLFIIDVIKLKVSSKGTK